MEKFICECGEKLNCIGVRTNMYCYHCPECYKITLLDEKNPNDYYVKISKKPFEEKKKNKL